ncbi:integrase [Duganella sp. SG902]|nr:hypothetical protein [Duganella sp. SG902]NVM75639.1 integrase [Duganella sp. SG902]
MAKSEERDAQLIDATITFELVARDWLAKTASERAATTTKKKSLAGQKLLPQIGNMPISAIKPRDVLLTVQKVQARGLNLHIASNMYAARSSVLPSPAVWQSAT